MLTKRQKQILDYIKKYIEKNDYAPTLEEIRRHFRLSSISTVHQHLENLKTKGYLIRLDNQPRSIQLIRKKSDNFVEIIEDSDNIDFPQTQLLSSQTNELKEKVILKKYEKVQKDETSPNQNKKLDISFKKICNCPPNRLNCLNAKQWIKYQVAIWEFSYEKRDIRDKNIHPAVFPIALPARCIELFTHKGELVLDPFVGTGTTLIAARDLERNAVGFDLNKKYVDFANKRLSQTPLFSNTKQIAICDDAINIPNYLEENTVSLSVTSPPYANMLNRPRENKSLRGDLRNNQYYKKIQQYSQNPRDLGTMEPKKFAEALGEIYKRILPLHKPRAHCVINITDLWWNNKRIPLHLYVIEALEKAGYELRNIIIWDRRNLVNKAGIFGWPSNYITLGTTFEYILDFWRPK
jgi:DNA modification methylase